MEQSYKPPTPMETCIIDTLRQCQREPNVMKAYTTYQQAWIIKTTQMYFYIEGTVEENEWYRSVWKRKGHKQECNISEIYFVKNNFTCFEEVYLFATWRMKNVSMFFCTPAMVYTSRW
jgi:hypothetical protein